MIMQEVLKVVQEKSPVVVQEKSGSQTMKFSWLDMARMGRLTVRVGCKHPVTIIKNTVNKMSDIKVMHILCCTVELTTDKMDMCSV